jgi:caffeic acid 3-O-methyltransferase
VNVWQHILHDWDDEKCIQILRNCLRALPDHGKVILSESVVTELVDNDQYTSLTASFDLVMLTQLVGGMERTKGQWAKLLGFAGFARIQFVQLGLKTGLDQWLIECYPTEN